MHSNLKLSLTRGILTSALLLLAGCYSVTVRPDGGYKVATKPTYEQRQDFYLWGLVGESHIDVKEVCKAGPVQFQSQRTFVDGLLALVTLGIYAPESARVWCK
jgi:Bor protein